MAYKGCSARRRAEEIQQIKTLNKLSYAEAIKRIQEQRETKEPGNCGKEVRAEDHKIQLGKSDHGKVYFIHCLCNQLCRTSAT